MKPRAPRLPFGGEHPWLQRVVVIAALAAGGAAAWSLALVGRVPASVVPCGAAAAAVIGLVPRRRGRSLFLVMAALPTMYIASRLPDLRWTATHAGAGVLEAVMVGGPFALACFALVWGARWACRRPALDALDRTLLAASTWLLIVAGGSGALGEVPVLWGKGGLTSAMPSLALLLGAAMAGAVLARDRGRRRWLAEVLAGKAPAWKVVPRDPVPAEGDGAVLPFVDGRGDARGALVSLEAEGAPPFRRAQVSSVVAWVPLAVEDLARALRGRGDGAALLAFFQVAAAASFGSWWVTHRPLSGVIEVAAGRHHACARLTDGTVQCWGANGDAQLGDGTRDERDVAGPVAGLRDVVEIAAGKAYTCARRGDGTVACWGTAGDLVPTDVRGISAAVRIFVHGDDGCAIATGGGVSCWSATAKHKGDDGHVARPLPVPEGTRIVGLAIQDQWVCIRTDDRLFCQDLPDSRPTAEVLDGLEPLRCLPRQTHPWMAPPGEPPPLPWSLVPALGPDQVCELRAHGQTRCWGKRDWRDHGVCNHAELWPDVPSAQRFGFVSRSNGCSLDASGAVRCWSSERPQGTTILTGARSLSGDSPICAARDDGTAWCWGEDAAPSALGGGTRRHATEPVLVRR